MIYLSKQYFKLIVLFAIFIIGGGIMLGLTGCSKEENNSKESYNVDYCGAKESYQNAKDSYKVGEKVTLYFNEIATDTDYNFSVDGEDASISYDNDKGFVIEFTMPAHDVTVKCNSRNTMIKENSSIENTLIDYTVDVYTAEGNEHKEIVLSKIDTMGKVQIDLYIDEEGYEKKYAYIVPYEVVDKCYDIIDKNKLDEWNSLKEAESIDGVYKSCKFLKDGKYICVSTEYMPTGGMHTLNEIEVILKSYMKKEYLA